MPGRIARTHTAERVAELLRTRSGRSHLAKYGWFKGMPIVMTTPSEPVNDVMGMVSMHGQAALVAMIDPECGELEFLYVSTPQPALKQVPAEADDQRIAGLFARTADSGLATFRVKYWAHSAVAHRVPAMPRTTAPVTADYTRRFLA